MNWCHVVCAFLCLPYFAWHNAHLTRLTHVASNEEPVFFTTKHWRGTGFAKAVWSAIASCRALLGGPEKPRTEEPVVKGKQENRAAAAEYRAKSCGSSAGGRAESGAPHSSLQEADMKLEAIQRLFWKIILGRLWKPAGSVRFSKMMLPSEATHLENGFEPRSAVMASDGFGQKSYLLSRSSQEILRNFRCSSNAVGVPSFTDGLKAAWKRRSKEG